ncbi:ABC transporter substrate-binding protein [Halostagnicola bangensis]
MIGGLQPYSGAFADFSAAYEPGIEFALEEINDNGGVLDKELSYNGIDTETNPREATTAATQLVESEGAVALVGPVSSDVGVATANHVEDLEVPLFLHAAGDHQILSTDSRYTFRVGHLPAPTTIQAQAEVVEEEGYESVSAIIGDYAWGRAVEESIEEFFPVDVQIEVAPFEEDNFNPYLRNLPEDTEFLVGSGHPSGVHGMFTQMLEIGLEPDLFTGGLQEPSASYNAIGDDITRGFAFFHQPDVYSDQYREAADRFYEESGEYFGSTQALGYVTTHLIAQAVENADSEDPTEISDAVREIELDTLFEAPLEYSEWGELNNQSQIYSEFETEAPDYYPDGDFRLVESFRSEPLEPYNPDEMPLG